MVQSNGRFWPHGPYGELLLDFYLLFQLAQSLNS